MGRPKLDTYWYVFVIAAVVLTTIGIVKLALWRQPGPGDPDWYSADTDKMGYYGWIFGGVICGIQGAQLWAKRVSRIKIPDDVRREEKRRRKLLK